ncbi:hypothetical protein SDC9_196008 [bioreactor metagenome]|uniref:Uncharacterized protein n=1 Tax=bioreactor metagenome TaxID=1076179 RepID=A0A645IAN4_9ZZZZ
MVRAHHAGHIVLLFQRAGERVFHVHKTHPLPRFNGLGQQVYVVKNRLVVALDALVQVVHLLQPAFVVFICEFLQFVYDLLGLGFGYELCGKHGVG